MPAQTYRDQIARTVLDAWYPDHSPVKVADALLAAGMRPPAPRINTVEELDALPVRSVIVDDWDTVWRRGEASWFACDRHPDAPARIVLPAIVLHTPRNGDNR